MALKKTTQAMLQSQHFVQSTLDALSAHIAILNENGEILRVNDAWKKFADSNMLNDKTYGIGLNYLKVCDISANRNSSDAPVVATGIRDVIAGKCDDFQMEYPCHSPSERRWFVVRISRFEWYGELRIIVAHQNVSELKSAQIELRQNNQRIEAILNNVNNGIFALKRDGTIQSTNKAMARIFGYDVDALLDMNIAQLLDNFQPDYNWRLLVNDIGHEVTGIRIDGNLFPIHVTLNELRLDNGDFFTGVVQDITMRKRMEAEIIERERMEVALEKERELRELKNRFLSMMSHELRTPLTIIGLSHDSLKRYGHNYTPQEQEQVLSEIQNQVDYLSALVEDVMTLSRTEIDNLEIDLQETDIITYCRDVVEGFQIAYHKTHQIDFECEEMVLLAPIDRKLMRRPLTNLISNAIKYSPDGGKVTILLEDNDDHYNISVIDSGIGIPEEDFERLFEPFHRAGNVGTLQGTGLGLPISKQTVEAHGGTIDFESSEKGTTFVIQMPYKPHQYILWQ